MNSFPRLFSCSQILLLEFLRSSSKGGCIAEWCVHHSSIQHRVFCWNKKQHSLLCFYEFVNFVNRSGTISRPFLGNPRSCRSCCCDLREIVSRPPPKPRGPGRPPRRPGPKRGPRRPDTMKKNIHLKVFYFCSKQKSHTCPRDSVILVANGWGQNINRHYSAKRKRFCMPFYCPKQVFIVCYFILCTFSPCLACPIHVFESRSSTLVSLSLWTPWRNTGARGLSLGNIRPWNNVFPRYSQSHTWVRGGGNGGGITPPRTSKKVLPPRPKILFTAIPHPPPPAENFGI